MRGVGLGDTTGMATPPLVIERCRHLKGHVPELPIALHFHNTRGIGLVNVMAGLRGSTLQASFAGLGGCPFAPGAHRQSAEDCSLLTMGIATGSTGRCAHRPPSRRCSAPHQQVMKAGPRLRLHDPDEVATAAG
jgi:hydroxymethylglutaryl-CoA lyase